MILNILLKVFSFFFKLFVGFLSPRPILILFNELFLLSLGDSLIIIMRTGWKQKTGEPVTSVRRLKNSRFQLFVLKLSKGLYLIILRNATTMFECLN
jgi:hypothetical protein